MMLVDSHCHLDILDLSRHDGRVEQVLLAARDASVEHFLCVCISMENRQDVLALAERFPYVSASVGVHPNHGEGAEPSEDELVRYAQPPQVVAIGETGLDYYRSSGDVEWQRERFRRHIRAARRTGKPLIIHSRAAREDTIAILREEGADAAGGVMHCFAEDWDTARRAMDLGFYISFSGIITFRNAEELRQVARRVPVERLLVETDAPYLAPVPYRGKPNQPAYVAHVAETLAGIRSMDLMQLAEQTTGNFFRLFPGAAAQRAAAGLFVPG